ncbi:GDP-L-fucose synthase family protein [Sphingomonas sp. ac-8]|uniref:GDP-L-fucose synthase family protein n=1 Tax=Sphingomonas sp. ac-8 TaxID=3242977 RepID=UPI003A7FEECE
MPSEGFSLSGKRIWIAGHRGMVGAALMRRLASEGCTILTVPRAELDLRRQEPVERWVATHRPDAIFLAAARVGGILANDRAPADFLHDNLLIAANVVAAAHRSGVGKLMLLGSSCIYPRLADQPIAEEALLTGPLEPTNRWYAVAKIAGVKLCQAYRRQHGCDFVSVMPTNLYGPGDNFDLASSHVLPALILKAHEAKRAEAASLEIWGSGTPRREFLHVDDLADACVHLMRHYSDERPINIGSGEEIRIVDLARLVADVVGFTGVIVYDASKPDGTPRKLLDSRRLRATGWRPRIGLRDGIGQVYAAWQEGQA